MTRVAYLFVALCVVYILHLLFYYISFDADLMFGYLDYQIHWQSQYNLIAGKVLYRDFYWEYGFLPIFLRLPFFFLFGKTFYSNFFNNFVFLPVLGIITSYYIGKQYLNKKSLIVFLFLLFLYRTNSDYSSFRHLIPELGLITAMLGIYEKNVRKQWLGSFLLGISLISSAEYALISNISYVLFFIIYLCTKEKKDVVRNFLKTFSFQLGIGCLFLFYLIKNNIFNNYINFNLQFVKAFYIHSPDRSLFPRPDTLAETFSGKEGFLLNLFVFFQRLNIYAIAAVLLFLIVWNIYNRKSKWFILNTVLILYSILAYSRTLSTPGYIHYGLTFIFLLIASIPFQETVTKRTRITAMAIIVWLCIASGYMSTLKSMGDFVGKTAPPVEKEYLPVAGMALNKPLTHEYKKVVSYIMSHTTPSDYIYTYPDGPYNQLTNRKTPVSVTSSSYYGLMPALAHQVRQELATHKPAYVIINTYNSSSYYSAINGYTYNIYSERENIFIDGYVTEVEDYIQQNYDLVAKFPIAWVLKRRDNPKPLTRTYEPVIKQWNIRTHKLEQQSNLFDNSQSFKVLDNNFEIYLLTDSFDNIDMIQIPIHVDLGIIKPFSKFVFNVGLVTDTNKIYVLNSGFISSDWQNIVVYIPKIEAPATIQAVVMHVPGNNGFLFFGKPTSVKIKPPQAYSRNKTLQIDDSIFKQR